MNRTFVPAAALATVTAVLATAVFGPVAAAHADGRQNTKNTDRNLGIGLGAAAAYEAIHGKGTNALLLGAGAAYAGKKYEDTRKEQAAASRRRAAAARRAAYLRRHRKHH